MGEGAHGAAFVIERDSDRVEQMVVDLVVVRDLADAHDVDVALVVEDLEVANDLDPVVLPRQIHVSVSAVGRGRENTGRTDPACTPPFSSPSVDDWSEFLQSRASIEAVPSSTESDSFVEPRLMFLICATMENWPWQKFSLLRPTSE